MRITVVGAGNIGTQFAVHCAEKGHQVTLFGSKPEKISKELTIINESNQVIHRGIIAGATSDPAVAFGDAELVFVVTPATLMAQNAALIEPFATGKTKICLVPGTGGGECAFKCCMERGAVVFGLQRVPSVARLVEYGKTVRAVGYREELFAAAMPHGQTEMCCRLIQDIFDIKTTPLPNYLNITLTPSNPVLHTTRLKNLFGDYHPGVVYDRVPLFYEEWNDATSEVLLKCDDEVQALCRKLRHFDLSHVRSLRQHYDSPTAAAMTRKISSIAGFKGLKSPMKPVEGGFVPDFTSRYFTADFPYGLAILVQLADLVGLEAPTMHETLDWYYRMVGQQREFHYETYGLDTMEKLIAFYAM